MEHLDLAGVITTPTNWSLPVIDQQDAIYLSNSRQMLEPILEETSEDEEHAQNSWNQYENNTSFWSSAESETGSVIRIEVSKDPDSISERDFACPAKRARRSDEFLIGGALTNAVQQQQQQQQQHLQVPNSSLDDTVLLRRHQRVGNSIDYNETNNSLERFLAYEAASRDSLGSQQRSSTGSRRFDDFYSDSDSLSFQSLSRSSSLIQFESLERQLLLQEQHASMSSLGNSSPSLLSFDGANVTNDESGARSGANSGSNSGNNSRRGSQSSLLKRFESSDGRLHQTYFDLDKLNFDDEETVLFGSGVVNKTHIIEATIGELKSDSESSTSSGSSSGHSILTASKPSAEDLTDSSAGALSTKTTRINNFQRGGKNSAENLSEDSGYCEPSTLRRTKSKSIPKNFEKFCEEEEEFQQQYEYECTLEDNDEEGDEVDENTTHSNNSTIMPSYATAANVATDSVEHDICQPKINDATFIVESTNINSNEPTTPESSPASLLTAAAATCPYYDDHSADVKNSTTRESLLEHRRSLAHSPSPAASDASSGSSCHSNSSRLSHTSATSSVSTCASAASFTWLPTTTTKTLMQQQQQPQRQQHSMAQLETLGEFCATLRNSLPDIRDALSTEACYFAAPTAVYSAYRQPQQQHQKCLENGYGLEHSKTTATKTKLTKTAAIAVDDSDISSSSTCNSAQDSRSDETDAETTPEARKRCVGSSVGTGINVKGCGGGGGGSGGSSIGIIRGCYGNRRRISSVPNELNKLGRKKRTTKYKYSKSSSEEEQVAESTSNSSADECEDDFFESASLKIRRSCSWSERRERNLQRCEVRDARRLQAQSLGYMNASYQNLTLLDYSENTGGVTTKQNLENHKRGCSIDMESSTSTSRKSNAGYEDLICKGNFLLDELSEIYDKNASILNDKTVEESGAAMAQDLLRDSYREEQEEAVCLSMPRVPPRQRKHSTSSRSDEDDANADVVDNNVQHVQLTIRNPPARQKHSGYKSEVTNSLGHEPPTFTTFGKTFDQDPTNLRTSYAQSLEKCNFDTSEVSNTELNQTINIPKRRFHSQAGASKKRTLVSSTPNLNAYQPGNDEIEDDMYVSSAHTSMHQLPQSHAQKPLGILLPVGSRNSFSKEVSFCPVVSKYCWQEQSSEENAEAQQLQRQDGQDVEEEETDDELLDNADATLIHNTKENELIAARYNEECNLAPEEKSAKSELKEEERIDKVRALLIVNEQAKQRVTQATIEQSAEREPAAVTAELCDNKTLQGIPANETTKHVSCELDGNEVSLKTTSVDSTTPVEEAYNSSANEIASTYSTNTTTRYNSNNSNSIASGTTRPLSIQLPILSEPPTNRAHHILYASQQMLDNLQRREREEQQELEQLQQLKAKSVSSIQIGQQTARMPNVVNEQARSSGGSKSKTLPPASNNNNELMKTKFKADEKHPSSKGFLSRFANGFRFSLRRNKKKQQQLQQQKEMQQQQQLAADQQQQQRNGNVAKAPEQTKGSAKTKQTKQPDFIYIPLKGPLPADASRSNSSNSNSNNNSSTPTKHNISQSSTVSAQSSPTAAAAIHQQQQFGAKLNGQQEGISEMSNAKVTGKPPLPKLPPRTVSITPASQSAGPHAQYQQQQQQQQQQLEQQELQMSTNFMSPQAERQFYTDFLDTERAYYYDDDLKNQLNTGMQANGCISSDGRRTVGGVHNNRVTMPALADYNNVGGGASGDTSTLSHIANSAAAHKIGLIETNLDTHETIITGKTRSLVDIGPKQTGFNKYAGASKRLNLTCADGDVEIVDDDDDDDVGLVVDANGVTIKTTQSGGQIASVRRPHKSMEFLLDKENQKNVLPPENELQKSHDHNPAALSEHQLRVQASLQRLNIPDWFRQYNQTARSPEGVAGAYKPGNFTRKRTTESGRWAGLNSKTTSLSSLGSQRSDRSPLLLSPSAHSHHGGQTAVAGGGAQHQHHHTVGSTGAYGTGGPGSFSRWSTSHLNSSQTSPSVSQRGSFTRGGPVNSSFMSIASGNSSVIRNSFRQPYLGWRSQEKLSQRTPHERLASSLLAQQQRTSPTQRTATALNTANGAAGDKLQAVTPEIQTSIKEVTSAIVHYVNDQTNPQRSRSTSPNSRKCWLESSFVGIRPLDSPQTPIIENTATTFSSAAVATNLINNYNSNYNNNTTTTSNSSVYLNNSSGRSSLYSNTLIAPGTALLTNIPPTTAAAAATNVDVLRMNGRLSICGGIGGGESHSILI